MPACGLHVHARFRCLDGKRGKHLAVLADHGHCHANDPDEIFLAVERNLFLANLPQFGLKPGADRDGAIREAP